LLFSRKLFLAITLALSPTGKVSIYGAAATKIDVKVAQRQVLTPGLMQMVSVLALNKLELKEMIDAEMVENPVLEEIDESVPMLDEVAGREERQAGTSWIGRVEETAAAPPKDSSTRSTFGSYFQDYLDPGYRTQPEYEDSEKPSFENFLSQPTTLSDHLAWQLGALTLSRGCTRRRVRDRQSGRRRLPGRERRRAGRGLLRKSRSRRNGAQTAGVGKRPDGRAPNGHSPQRRHLN
jgi:hypothetical protein